MSYSNDLTKIHTPSYQGYPLIPTHKPYIKQYLDINEEVLNASLGDHPRTLAARIDLRIPYGAKNDPAVISRCFEALGEKIQVDLDARERNGQRRRKCQLRYIWAREQEDGANEHYHVVIFLNGDCYMSLGEMSVLGEGLFGSICASWARATGWPIGDVHRFVYVPKNPIYRLNANSSDLRGQANELLKRLAYMAKEKSKVYGDRKKSYSSSRK